MAAQTHSADVEDHTAARGRYFEHSILGVTGTVGSCSFARSTGRTPPSTQNWQKTFGARSWSWAAVIPIDLD